MNSIRLVLILILFIFSADIIAQSNPQKLDSGITINRIMTVKNGVIRMAKDPVTKNLYYIQTGGNIYQVVQPPAGPAYDSLVDSTAHHTVDYVQGMAFHDSTLYVSGNNHSDSSKTAGIIARGKLQPNGIRVWDTLMITEYYQTADYFDHLFSGLVVNLAGDSIYICSGARGDHGEIQTRYGTYPGLRNVPLTTNIFVLPTHNSAAIILQNDSALLAASGYVYCRGVRNHFDMAFDASGNLFGVENSGDRDHNEEMNWLQRGHHYGFPWKMGDTDNPQQFPGFVPANDKLINHYCRAWRNNFWNNDPTFPQPPVGVTLDAAIQNFGPDCDKYRDTAGYVHDASDSGISIGTFTAHRSPLGLVFDMAGVFGAPYTSDAFMLSWTKGYDSCGCTVVPDTGVGPFVDPSQDLVHLDLAFDSVAGNFSLHATRIIAEFQHPVDADIDSNKIYVIENGYGGTSGLYEVIFPGKLPCNPVLAQDFPSICDPDSNIVSIDAFGTLPDDIYWYNSSGILLRADTNLLVSDTIWSLAPGNYYALINDNGTCGTDSLPFFIPEPLSIVIDSSTATTCIGCSDGIIYFHPNSGAAPYTYFIIPSVVLPTGSPISGLPPGNYVVCVTDANGCVACDTVDVLDDPTAVSKIDNERKFVLYPNPVVGSSTLRFIGGGDVTVRIFDLNGKQIQLLTNENSVSGIRELPINCTELSNGCYTLEIKSGTKRIYRKMIVLK